MSLALHDDVSWLAFLLGTWRGEGTGEYPTIEPFTYRETVTFDHAGDAWFSYIQESWTPDGKPLHFERGFLRPGNADGDVEFVLAHPIGVTEVAHGRFDGDALRLTAQGDAIARAATGSDVRGLERRYAVNGDTLIYELDMATGTTPLTLHLTGNLRRQM